MLLTIEIHIILSFYREVDRCVAKIFAW